jgi:gas vesicle protein
MSNNNKELAVGISVGLGVGLIVGATLGLLFAPKSGLETRTYIKDTVDKGVTKIKSIPADIRAKLHRGKLEDVKPR